MNSCHKFRLYADVKLWGEIQLNRNLIIMTSFNASIGKKNLTYLEKITKTADPLRVSHV